MKMTIDWRPKDVTSIIAPIVDRNLRTLFVDVMLEVAKEKAPPPPKFGDVPATGFNKASIKLLKSNRGDWAIGTTSGYGGYLEFGTRKMKARPYFLPAADVAKRNVESSRPKDWE
jgi:hypothetical protein